MQMLDPILTIVTRHMPTRRKLTFRRMHESIAPMLHMYPVQHLVVEDRECKGYQHSGKLMAAAAPDVLGHYVWVLDDDDECTCAYLPSVLYRLYNNLDPDIIIVKNWMQKHGILPSKEIWNAQDINAFKPCTIGFPGFILKNEVYKTCIPAAQTVKHRIDWAVFNWVQRLAHAQKLQSCFLDLLVMRQPVKMAGKDEGIEEGSLLAKVLFGED